MFYLSIRGQVLLTKIFFSFLSVIHKAAGEALEIVFKQQFAFHNFFPEFLLFIYIYTSADEPGKLAIWINTLGQELSATHCIFRHVF
jgi:hypothetical protein